MPAEPEAAGGVAPDEVSAERGVGMLGRIRSKWNAARQRRFQQRVAKHMRTHFSEVLGADEGVLDLEEGLDILYDKYFGGTAA